MREKWSTSKEGGNTKTQAEAKIKKGIINMKKKKKEPCLRYPEPRNSGAIPLCVKITLSLPPSLSRALFALSDAMKNILIYKKKKNKMMGNLSIESTFIYTCNRFCLPLIPLSHALAGATTFFPFFELYYYFYIFWRFIIKFILYSQCVF